MGKRKSWKTQRKIMNHIWGKPKKFYKVENKEKGKEYQKQPATKLEELENLYDRLFFAEKYKECIPVYAEILYIKVNQ